MRLTAALHVRQWLSKLHPPLPQTPRESQQLLQILEGSFRKHLDEVHPSPAQKPSAGVHRHEIPLISSESSSYATQQYFNSVLNNPLLSKPNAGILTKTPSTLSAVNRFADASVKGAADVALLRQCASDYLQGLKSGEKIADKDHLADRLTAWVYTTSPANRVAFFGSKETLKLAVQVVGADHEEGIAWDWLRILYERKFGTETEEVPLNNARWLAIEDFLVSCIMQLSIRQGALNDAAQQFLKACQYRTDSARAAARLDDVANKMAYVPLENSWKRLAAAVIHHRTRHGVSQDLFDRSVQYGLTWSYAPEFSKPIVAIYHPSSPSASSLAKHLQKAESASRFLSGHAKAGKRFRKAMLGMILDGAQLSLEQGLRKDARFLLEFAHTHYSEYLPSPSQKVTSSLDIQIQTAQGELKAHSYNFAGT